MYFVLFIIYQSNILYMLSIHQKVGVLRGNQTGATLDLFKAGVGSSEPTGGCMDQSLDIVETTQNALPAQHKDTASTDARPCCQSCGRTAKHNLCFSVVRNFEMR